VRMTLSQSLLVSNTVPETCYLPDENISVRFEVLTAVLLMIKIVDVILCR
jgi:hypothetical protein